MLYSGMTVGQVPNGFILIVAAMIGGYMAINIGAIFEASGALIAGGEVVSTIKKGIIDPALIADTDTFVWLMLAAAIWLNIATAVGAPVSTTHSI